MGGLFGNISFRLADWSVCNLPCSCFFAFRWHQWLLSRLSNLNGSISFIDESALTKKVFTFKQNKPQRFQKTAVYRMWETKTAEVPCSHQGSDFDGWQPLALGLGDWSFDCWPTAATTLTLASRVTPDSWISQFVHQESQGANSQQHRKGASNGAKNRILGLRCQQMAPGHQTS